MLSISPRTCDKRDWISMAAETESAFSSMP
jgi:hypothetical protein